MKLKQLFATLIILSCTLFGFTACNDEDYAPIQLTEVNDNGHLNHNTLQIDAYNPGESFLIYGGNGRYVIENKNDDIVDYRYDGHTLTIIPVGVGTATILIRDHAGSRMTLTIEVSNPTSFLKAISTEAKAYGDDMTGNQMKTLEKQMLEEALLQSGGDILLTYTNKEYSIGSVTIHPGSSSRPIVGTFRQTQKMTDNNENYLELEVRLADNRLFFWQLFNYNEESNKEMLLLENVTEKYQETFATLEKATLTYIVTR